MSNGNTSLQSVVKRLDSLERKVLEVEKKQSFSDASPSVKEILRVVKKLEDELVARKMAKISDEVNTGKRKVMSEAMVKKKYGFE